MNKCAICESRTSSENPYSFFCWRCYEQFKDYIKAREAWVKYLINLEAKRRYRDKNHRISLIYLGDKWDIDDSGNLVRRSRNG